MPRFEPKDIQNQLKNGTLWPVYVCRGQEAMKTREIINRIKKTALEEIENPFSYLRKSALEQGFDANVILDEAQSLLLGCSRRVIVVDDAEKLKDPERLFELCVPPDPSAPPTAIVILIIAQWDGRKKHLKLFEEKAAVVHCEAVAERDRSAWIKYLADRRKLSLTEPLLNALVSKDPWSLDIVDMELSRLEIFNLNPLSAAENERQPETTASLDSKPFEGELSQRFIQAFFARDFKELAEVTVLYQDKGEDLFMTLGLLAWHLKQRILGQSESGFWNRKRCLHALENLKWMDFDLKQTQKSPAAAWLDLGITTRISADCLELL